MECKKCGCMMFSPTIYPTGAACDQCGTALSGEDFNKLCTGHGDE